MIMKVPPWHKLQYELQTARCRRPTDLPEYSRLINIQKKSTISIISDKFIVLDGCYDGPNSAVKILWCFVTHIDITEFQILSD